MSYRPDEKEWMAYLYGESEGQEKEKIERYLLENAEARQEFEKFQQLRKMMSSVEDKEVIAPPIFIGDTEGKQRYFWNAPYFNTIISIAASLLLIILVGKLTGTSLSYTDNELKLSFGNKPSNKPVEEPQQSTLTGEQVQDMINKSLTNNNTAMQASWTETQHKLDESIKKNLAYNSNKIDKLVREASNASQQQISDYVASLQTQNMQLVKDYFQLTSTDQKKYIEDLLVDFAGYLQQQRNNDLQLVESKFNSMEQNTNMFKQETEQILASIITTVGNQGSKDIKN